MKRPIQPKRASRRRASIRRPRVERLELRQLLAADGVSLVDDSIVIQQNSATMQIDPIANDSFDDGYAGARRITAVSTGSLGGRIEIGPDGQSLSYAPPADTSGDEVFRYTVDDVASAEVNVQIVSPLGDFKETIYLFRDEYRLDLLADASFAEDYTGARRITLISETALGADVRISDDGSAVIYRSRVGRQGEDQFTYIVDDRFVATARVEVVNPLEADRYEVLQNSGRTNLPVLDNDFQAGSDSGFDLSQVRSNARITHVLSDGDDFRLEIASDARSIDFIPAEDFAGHYVPFRYVVDGQFEQTVRMTVHRPVQDDFANADSDGGVHTLNVLANDTYRSIFSRENVRVVDRITSVTQGDQGGHLEISSDGRRVLYTPAAGFLGTENFQYVADEKYQASVNVNVTQPVRDDWQKVYVGTNTPISVLANDFASDAGAQATITSVGTSNIGASITLENGSIVYSPPEDALQEGNPVRSDQFDYTVNDQYTATVYVNLASITVGDFVEIDRALERQLDVLRNDHFGLHYPGAGVITNVSTPSGGGAVNIADGGRGLLYQPGSQRESFTYTVDDRYVGTVQIVPIRRLRGDRAVADQNGPAVIVDVLANDFPEYANVIRDHGPYLGQRELTAVTQSEQGGAVSIDVRGRVSYQPPEDFFGRDSFTYTVDGFLTEVVHVDVVRRAADDLVRVAPGSEDNQLNVLANDILGSDYSGPGLITDVSSSDANGSLEISSDGRSVLYTPPTDFRGQDSFVYVVDGQSKATVTVSVHDDSGPLLSKFETATELKDYLLGYSIDRYKNQFGENGYSYHFVEDQFRSEQTFASAGFDFSETNVQVAGVDEDDIVETDGNFIYSLRHDELHIVESFPADELALVSQTQIEGVPVGMYLNGDRITVISRLVEFAEPLIEESDQRVAGNAFVGDVIYPWPIPRQLTTIVTVLDVTDRSAPQVVQRTTIDGDFTDSRRIGDRVFLVLGSQDLMIEPELVCDEGNANCVYETEQAFTDRVNRDFATLIEDRLPNYASYDREGQEVRGGPLVLPEDIYQSLDKAVSMTIVLSINMASNEPGLEATSAVLTDAGSQIYATAESLYVFESHREAVEGELWTRISKFDWDGASGAVDFAATGDVPGTLLDQFSADESDGLLRVTTEISNSGTGNFSGRNETGLFVLRDDHGVLEFVGSLQNLALGQEVKSVRYFGESAMVTTFPARGEPVDPLYAIDLSDASNPRVLGHVPIPGFSSYMQFIGPDRLLTVGTNTATGHGGRAMVSLFDVSDLTSPRLIDQYNLPQYSTSQANLDHHAFGWFERHQLLAVPISRTFQDRFDDDQDGYAEAIRTVREDALSMLNVSRDDATDKGSITLRGTIEHADSVLRSLYVNENIYSVGLDAIRTVHVDRPGTVVAEVLFPNQSHAVPVQPRSESRANVFATHARQELAQQMGISEGSVIVVAHETQGDELSLVLRAGEKQYRYRGVDAESLVLADQEFAFVSKWHNDANPNDVNGDGEVSAGDALNVINEIRRRGGRDLPVDRVLRQMDAAVRFADTNGDGIVSSVDALRVINQMGRDLLSSEVAAEQLSSLQPLHSPAMTMTTRTEAIDDVLRGRDDDREPLLF